MAKPRFCARYAELCFWAADGNLTRLCLGLLGDDNGENAVVHRGLDLFAVDALGQGEDTLEGTVFALGEVARFAPDGATVDAAGEQPEVLPRLRRASSAWPQNRP